jgi:hypothetical protein
VPAAFRSSHSPPRITKRADQGCSLIGSDWIHATSDPIAAYQNAADLASVQGMSHTKL